MRTLRAYLGLALVAMIAPSCDNGSIPAGGCKADSECAASPNGTVCDKTKHTCVACSGDSTCGVGQHCDTANNRCAQCVTAAQCAMNQLCADGICRAGCDAQHACPAGQICLMNGGPLGACVQCAVDKDCAMQGGGRCTPEHSCVACLSDGDCASGQVCKNQKCADGCNGNHLCATGVCDFSSGACVACTRDGDCKSSAAPRCDGRTNTCVACLPGADNCPAGQYCANQKCVAGCRGDGDCQVGNPPPASLGRAHCLVGTNTCVGCLINSDCAQGFICAVDHSCTKGCTGDNNCGQGQGCCNGQCAALNTGDNCGVCGNACAQGSGCCSGQCVLFNSNSNCGGCGVSCGQGQACCNGACLPINTPQNCGACGVACGNAGGCCGQVCVAFNTVSNCGGCNTVCGLGQTCCGTCSNMLTDAMNCGTCGTVCAQGQICCSGQCKSPNVPGACVDCSRACNAYDTASGGAWGAGVLNQLGVDGNGNLSTVPASKNPPPSRPPHVWIANHDSNQISKIDAGNGTLLGTFPSGGGNPSRAALALDGSFWIGHRGQNCNVSDPACSNVVNMNIDGSIRCTVGKAADGQPLPFVRALSIDKNGYIWFGTWNDARMHQIDPNTCKVLQDIPMVFNGQNSSPYGFAIDSKGILWNSNLGTGPVWLAFDTNLNKYVGAVPIGGTSYGVTIDRKDNVFLAQWCGPNIFRIDGVSKAVTSIATAPVGYCPRGMTTDVDGNVWAAMFNGGASYVAKFANGTGALLGNYAQTQLTSSVAVAGDSFGNVWLAGNYVQGGTAAVRFPRSINADNQIDFLTKMIGGYPYTYSDWTGIVLRTVTSNNAQAGTWVQAFDGQSPTTTWQTATWLANTPKGTTVKLRFAAAASFGGLKNAALCGPFLASPADLTTCNFGPKQWLGVTVEMTTNDVNVQPTMSDLKLFYQN